MGFVAFVVFQDFPGFRRYLMVLGFFIVIYNLCWFSQFFWPSLVISGFPWVSGVPCFHRFSNVFQRFLWPSIVFKASIVSHGFRRFSIRSSLVFIGFLGFSTAFLSVLSYIFFLMLFSLSCVLNFPMFAWLPPGPRAGGAMETGGVSGGAFPGQPGGVGVPRTSPLTVSWKYFNGTHPWGEAFSAETFLADVFFARTFVARLCSPGLLSPNLCRPAF